MPQSFQEILQLTSAFSNLPTTSGGGGGGPNNTRVAFSQNVQPGGTKTENPPRGKKPTNDQKGLGKKTNPKGISFFFGKQKGIDYATHLVSDCLLETAQEKA